MRQIFLTLSLLLAAALLVGCEETTTETTEETSAEVTARLCHIARIGNLAEIPDELWEDEKKSESSELPADLDLSGKMKEAPIAKAVGEEVDPDILAIVESAAKESTNPAEIKKAKEKKEELDLAIEMVNEKQEMDSEVENSLQKDAKAASQAKENEEEEDEDEEVAIAMDDEKAVKETEASETENEVNSADESETEEETAQESVSEEETEEAPEENATENKDSEKTTPETKKTTDAKSGEFEEEVERQAEEFLEILKNTPKEVREELKKANFQNVTYRLVKVPTQLLQEIPEECFIIRTMEYTGSNLSHDFQILNLSPNYSAWLQKQEKYLEIMTLDSLHHETWVEVPEFWNSSNE